MRVCIMGNKLTAKEADNILSEASEMDIPNIYFNGFVNALGIGDVVTVLQRNGKAVATVNMSYTVAKTLAIKLNGLIQSLEHDAKTEIMTTDDVTEKLNLK